MLKVLSNILCDLDPTVKVIGQKAGICDGVPSTSALVLTYNCKYFLIHQFKHVFWCSKEASHGDCSFEHQQHMFWLGNKKK